MRPFLSSLFPKKFLHRFCLHATLRNRTPRPQRNIMDLTDTGTAEYVENGTGDHGKTAGQGVGHPRIFCGMYSIARRVPATATKRQKRQQPRKDETWHLNAGIADRRVMAAAPTVPRESTNTGTTKSIASFAGRRVMGVAPTAHLESIVMVREASAFGVARVRWAVAATVRRGGMSTKGIPPGYGIVFHSWKMSCT